MKHQLVKLFEVIVWIAFAVIVLAGMGLGAAMSAGFRGPTAGGIFLGFLGGVTVGAIVTGFCMTLLSINDHLLAIRQAMGGEAALPKPATHKPAAKPARPDESRFHYLDTNNQSQGPVTLKWLNDALARGELTGETWVAKAGDKEWKPLRSLTDNPG